MRGMAIKQEEQRSTSRSINKSDIPYLKYQPGLRTFQPLRRYHALTLYLLKQTTSGSKKACTKY